MTSKSVRSPSTAATAPSEHPPQKRKRGPKPKPVAEFPEAIIADWIDVPAFHEALFLHAERHGDSICHPHKALTHQGDRIERSTLIQWAAGKKAPASVASMAILASIKGDTDYGRFLPRIHIHLIDGDKGFESWAHGYDGSLDGIFALQATVAQAVTHAIGDALGIAMAPPPARGMTAANRPMICSCKAAH